MRALNAVLRNKYSTILEFGIRDFYVRQRRRSERRHGRLHGAKRAHQLHQRCAAVLPGCRAGLRPLLRCRHSQLRHKGGGEEACERGAGQHPHQVQAVGQALALRPQEVRGGEARSAWHPPHAPSRYVWKLLYVYMLGYDVEFGHIEVRSAAGAAHAPRLSGEGAQAVGLISSPKYAEKLVGYMVTSVLLNEARARLSPRCRSC